MVSLKLEVVDREAFFLLNNIPQRTCELSKGEREGLELSEREILVVNF